MTKYPIQPEEIGQDIKSVGQLRESDTRLIINRQRRHITGIYWR